MAHPVVMPSANGWVGIQSKRNEDMHEKLADILRPYIKPAIKLEVKADLAAQAASVASKFGGLPYSEAESRWPACAMCQKPLTFVAQFEKRNECALHVFYYCFDCCSWGDSAEEGGWLVRRYAKPSMDKYQMAPGTPIVPGRQGSEIVPCSAVESEGRALPCWDGLDTEIPAATEMCSRANEESPWEAYNLAVKELGCIDELATVIEGYPRFLQAEVSKKCPLCAGEMEFLAQMDSESEADLMWGDVGLIYLFRCSQHTSEFGLELQCC